MRVCGMVVFLVLLGLTISQPGTVWSTESEPQDATEGQCNEDEIDAGEYCVQIVPVEPEPPGTPKATPFRKESMMPGVIRRGAQEKAVTPPVQKPPVVARQSIPAPVIAQGGFGIQLGAWSSRESAKTNGLAALELVTAVILSPLQRGENVLWACIAGPYASKGAAQPDLQLLRADRRFGDAWIKPLDGLRLEGIDANESKDVAQ